MVLLHGDASLNLLVLYHCLSFVHTLVVDDTLVELVGFVEVFLLIIELRLVEQRLALLCIFVHGDVIPVSGKCIIGVELDNMLI